MPSPSTCVFDTTSLAHRDAVRGERHPPHLGFSQNRAWRSADSHRTRKAFQPSASTSSQGLPKASCPRLAVIRNCQAALGDVAKCFIRFANVTVLRSVALSHVRTIWTGGLHERSCQDRPCRRPRCTPCPACCAGFRDAACVEARHPRMRGDGPRSGSSRSTMPRCRSWKRSAWSSATRSRLARLAACRAPRCVGDRVYLDRGLVRELIATIPSDWTYHARNPDKNLPFRRQAFDLCADDRRALYPRSGRCAALADDCRSEHVPQAGAYVAGAAFDRASHRGADGS